MLAFVLAGCGSGQDVQQKVFKHAATTPSPYVIGPDDELDIIVWKQPEVSGKVTVAADGTVTVPLAGNLKAAGLTTDQLQADLTKRLTPYIDVPNVTVQVADARSQVVYVLGQVLKPGASRLRPGEVLSQALADAGGFTDFADQSAIRISRRSPTETEEITVNFKRVSRGKDPSADIPLKAGDVITVP